jgi:hypothetical protein
MGVAATYTYHVWVRAKDADSTGAYSASKIALYDLTYLAGYHQASVAYYGYFVDDGFEISDSTTDTFTYYGSSLSTDIGFAGDIEGIIAEDENNGRIIIKITNAGSWYKEVNKYYAIAYKNASSYGVYESGAYKGGGFNEGVNTLEEAAAEYVYDDGSDQNGYFSYYGFYLTKAGGFLANVTGLQGRWTDDDGYDFNLIINGNTLLWFMDDYENPDGVYEFDDAHYRFIVGEIVDVTSNTNAGILFIHTVVAGDDGTGYLNDKYEAIAWKGSGSYSFFFQQDAFDSLAAAKSAYTDATNTSQFANNGFDDYTKDE